jgi:hypothetical protein
VIELAWRKGAKLEGWSDYFNFGAWQEAFAELGLDMDWYARRERPLDEVLPWEHISAGLKKQFLMDEYIHTYQGGVVDDCREHCFRAAFSATSRSSAAPRRMTGGAVRRWGATRIASRSAFRRSRSTSTMTCRPT